MDVDEKPSLTRVLEHYGAMEVPESSWWRSMRCPFHEDHHKSASVNTEDGQFRCFTCDVSGDVFDVVASQEGVNFVEAKRLAAEFAGEGDGAVRTAARRGSWLPVSTGSAEGDGGRSKARRRPRSRPWT